MSERVIADQLQTLGTLADAISAFDFSPVLAAMRTEESLKAPWISPKMFTPHVRRQIAALFAAQGELRGPRAMPLSPVNTPRTTERL